MFSWDLREDSDPNHVKRGVVRSLYQRARRVSENLKEEEKHLHKDFKVMVMTTQPLGQALKSYLLKITRILSKRKV